MEKYLYRLDEIGKVILRGLRRSGKKKTFADILDEAGFQYDNARQVEIAINLEALDLIQSVTYQLPIEIHAELSPLGEAVVKALQQVKDRKLKTMIENAQRRFRSDFDLSLNI
jgi:hypothetical protein